MKFHDMIKLFVITTLFITSNFALSEIVISGVYKWPDLKNSTDKKLIYEGEATDLTYLQIYAKMLEPKESAFQKDDFPE